MYDVSLRPLKIKPSQTLYLRSKIAIQDFVFLGRKLIAYIDHFLWF